MATFTVIVISGEEMTASHHVVTADNEGHARAIVARLLDFPEFFDVLDVECVNGIPAPSLVSAYSNDVWDFGYPDDEHDAHVAEAVFHIEGMRYNEHGNPCFVFGG